MPTNVTSRDHSASLPGKRSRAHKLAAAALIAVAVLMVVGIYVRMLSTLNAANGDFLEFWAQGKLLAQHANPFDPSATLALQEQAGLHLGQPRISFSPPVALWVLLPLGSTTPRTGLVLWRTAELVSLTLALLGIWNLHGRRHPEWMLLGYVFGPVLACLFAGQLGNFFVLGLVLFLILHRTHPFLAGAVLAPFALKPHLFLPFAAAVLLWIVVERTPRVLAGFAAALGASCALSFYLDPHCWAQYREMMHSTGVMNLFIPTLSVELRVLIDRRAPWIQFIPEICACAWAAWYFLARRARWDWNWHGLLVLLVAAVCSPYGWVYDEPVLLPAVLAGAYFAVKNGRSLLPIEILVAAALFETVSAVRINTPYYLWTTPAWLGWYLYATRPARQTADSPSAGTEVKAGG